MSISGPPPSPKPMLPPYLEQLETFNNAEDIARALMALDASQMGSWSQDVKAGQIWGDKRTTDILGIAPEHQPWTPDDFLNMVHPEDVDRIRQAVENVLSGTVPFYDVEMRLKSSEPTITHRWIGARAKVTERDAAGQALRLVGLVWDISEPKHHQYQLGLLAAEMDHRVKNAFAVIRALINIGATASQNTESFADTLRNQVEAMATAHTLSARMARSTNDANARVSLTEVIDTTLSPWTDMRDEGRPVVTITIDEEILLPPGRIAAMAMFLYELSTNATKYGPLGEREGLLNVSVTTADDGAVELLWREQLATTTDIPPAAPTQEQKGFGDILLNHCAGNLNAKLSREMTETGLWVKLQMTKDGLG